MIWVQHIRALRTCLLLYKVIPWWQCLFVFKLPMPAFIQFALFKMSLLFVEKILLGLTECILWFMLQPCAMPFWWGSWNRALWFLFPFCCLFCSLITFISATLKLMRLLGYVKENPVLISVLISYLCIFFFLSVMCSESQLLTCCDGCSSFGSPQSFLSQSKM